MNEEIKYCKFCGKEKTIKDFVKSGFCVKNICKDCNNKKQKDIYKNSKNYHKLQQENQQLKEQLELSEKARKKSIELLSISYSISVDYDGFNDVAGLKQVIDDMARYIKKAKVILDIDKGE